jgi:hypothetical protein
LFALKLLLVKLCISNLKLSCFFSHKIIRICKVLITVKNNKQILTITQIWKEFLNSILPLLQKLI